MSYFFMEILLLKQFSEFISLYFHLPLPSPVVSLPPSTITLYKVMILIPPALIVLCRGHLTNTVYFISWHTKACAHMSSSILSLLCLHILILPRLLASFSHASTSLTILFWLLKISPFSIWLIIYLLPNSHLK